MADRVVLIDPNDIEHPPALNLFDFGLDRLGGYAPKDREMLLNGAVALFEYMFGALLGAELTNRQQVIFRFIARLMMVVEGATIHTMREFMESPEATRPYLDRLDPTERHFFETQFYEGTYNDTRKQILARLWGVLSNRVLARMFSHPRNRVNLFEAMNRGSLILINTAKDLLKQEGTEIMGRFFIALIAHAAQERAPIPEDRRRSTFVYIDEAQDYFDSSMENLLNQARKYKVGLVLAHQNLGQFERALQAAVMASTAIKLAGGVSAHDASALAKEMRCGARVPPGDAEARRSHRVRLLRPQRHPDRPQAHGALRRDGEPAAHERRGAGRPHRAQPLALQRQRRGAGRRERQAATCRRVRGWGVRGSIGLPEEDRHSIYDRLMKKKKSPFSFEKLHKAYLLFWLAGIIFTLITIMVGVISYINRLHDGFVNIFPGNTLEPIVFVFYSYRYPIVIGCLISIFIIIYLIYLSNIKKWKTITSLCDNFFCSYTLFHKDMIDYVLRADERDAQSIAICCDALSKRANEFLTDSCDRISMMMFVYTGYQCHVSIKSYNSETKMVRTYLRDGRSIVDRSEIDEANRSYRYSSNTAFKTIMEDDKCKSYVSNHLWSLRVLQRYCNNHKYWWKLYNATLVVPITDRKTSENINGDTIRGFLCVDNRGGGFDRRSCCNMMSIFSRLNFTIFDLLARLANDPE